MNLKTENKKNPSTLNVVIRKLCEILRSFRGPFSVGIIFGDFWDVSVYLGNINQLSRLQPIIITQLITTLPETNIAPENGPSQKETHLPTIHVQVLC